MTNPTPHGQVPEALEDHQVRKLAAIGAVSTSSGLVERRPIEYRRELEDQFVRGFRAAEKRLSAFRAAHVQNPAIQRYKIGYHSDEWGVRSLSPTSIYDDAGPWVRYEDHAAVITALRAQQPAPAGATLPKGWVPLVITHEGQYPEEIAYGPQRMMDRLDKWLRKYFDSMVAAPTTQQAPQQPCPTCAALARTVMMDQVSFDRKPDGYGIRQLTDDESVEAWEDIRTSPDVAREEANDMMATGRGELYEVVPLWTTPQPSPTAQAAESVPALDRTRIREIFMAHGFTVKEGQTDLKQYVYDAADALLRAARAPADSVLEDAALSGEEQRAIFEAYESAASESYFEARPQIDCNDRRRVFKAGYERGWDAARKQGEKQ